MATRFRVPVFTMQEPVARVRQEIGNLYGNVFGGEGRPTWTTSEWAAPICVWEDEQNMFVEVELPGVKKEDLDLHIEKNVLTISATRSDSGVQRQYLYNERRYGKAERSVRIPETVDAEKVEAQLDAGVLYVSLAKKPETQPKQIKVKVAGEDSPTTV